MCLCICVTLADFFTLKLKKKNLIYADHVSVYVMLNVIILIQILSIRYNVNFRNISLLHAPDPLGFWTSKLKNALPTAAEATGLITPHPGAALGGTPPPPPKPSPRSVASLPRICHFSTRCPPPPNTLTHGTPLGAPIY